MPSNQHAGADNRRSTSSDAPFDGRLRPTTSTIPPGTVPRLRLVDRVSLGVQKPLTLISAPAGFGKTILLESWAALYQGPAVVRRITLDAGSEDAPALVESVRGGLRRGDHDVIALVVDCGDLTVTPKFGR